MPDSNKIWYNILDEYRYFTSDNLEDLYIYLEEIGIPNDEELLDMLHNILLDHRYNHDVKKLLMTLVFIENNIHAPFDIDIKNIKEHTQLFNDYILSNKYLTTETLFIYFKEDVALEIMNYRKI
jgi:hypothetical protein